MKCFCILEAFSRFDMEEVNDSVEPEVDRVVRDGLSERWVWEGGGALGLLGERSGWKS